MRSFSLTGRPNRKRRRFSARGNSWGKAPGLHPLRHRRQRTCGAQRARLSGRRIDSGGGGFADNGQSWPKVFRRLRRDAPARNYSGNAGSHAGRKGACLWPIPLKSGKFFGAFSIRRPPKACPRRFSSAGAMWNFCSRRPRRTLQPVERMEKGSTDRLCGDPE